MKFKKIPMDDLVRYSVYKYMILDMDLVSHVVDRYLADSVYDHNRRIHRMIIDGERV